MRCDGRFTIQERRRPQQLGWAEMEEGALLELRRWYAVRSSSKGELERIAGDAAIANHDATINGCRANDSGRAADAKDAIIAIIPSALHGIARAGFATDGAVTRRCDLKRGVEVFWNFDDHAAIVRARNEATALPVARELDRDAAVLHGSFHVATAVLD